MRGNPEIVELLLTRGADPNRETSPGLFGVMSLPCSISKGRLR
jgi:hypothetical protein